MNYKKTYKTLVEKAKERNLQHSETLYTENHHIKPKCMGGKRTVRLTAKEHFIAHHLLTKIYPTSLKLTRAFNMMVNKTSNHHQDRSYKVTASIFEYNRKRISEANKGQKGHWLGKKRSKETKRKLREANKGNKLSEETKRKLREALKGRIITKKAREKLREAHLNLPLISCPYCDMKSRNRSCMNRWHFKNCKHKKSS